MQRQSLGGSSSGSKLHVVHGGGAKEEKKVEGEEQKRNGGEGLEDELKSKIEKEKEKEKEKVVYHNHHRWSSSCGSGNEKSIHLIPILTLFCLLVLYLCSYDPSQKDLSHINGFIRPSNRIDSSSMENGDFNKFVEVAKGDILAIRSHRSLLKHGIQVRKSRLHRKFGGF